MRQSTIHLAMALALGSAPAVAASGGFTAADLANAAQAKPGDGQRLAAARQIAARTEVLRAILAANQPNAQKRISRDELEVLTIAIGPPTATRDVALSWLMRSGLTTAADGEISGIYSPLADAWLMLRWQKIGGSPRLTDAVMLRGVTLRPRNELDWQASSEPFLAAMFRTHRQAMSAFDALPEAIGGIRLFALASERREAERASVFDRVNIMLGGISAWSRSNPTALAAINRAARSESGKQLLPLPAKVRGDLSPMAVIDSPQGVRIVLLSPLYPARMVIAPVGSGAAPTLDFIDLAPIRSTRAER